MFEESLHIIFYTRLSINHFCRYLYSHAVYCSFFTRDLVMLGVMQESPILRSVFYETNHSELAAFTSYALAFPTAFQALVDTYNV